jgi:uncharacterized protein YybS (DUF2232 family)
MMSVKSAPHKDLSISRWFFLGIASVLLCHSYLMTVFTPFPLIMGMILYGRLKGYSLALFGMIVTSAFSFLFFKSGAPILFYFLMVIVAVITSESINRSFNSVKTIVLMGTFLFILLLLVSLLYLYQQNMTLTQWMGEQIILVQNQLQEIIKLEQSAELVELVNQFSDKEKMTQMFIEVFPGLILVVLFFVSWVNMFLALKWRRLLATALPIQKSEDELLNFKMPFFWVYFVIVAIVFNLWSLELGYPVLKPIGDNILRVLGIFYFFQGLSVIVRFSDAIGLVGFFRSIMIMITIFFGSIIIAALGLFDTWFDFTEKIKKFKIYKGE